MERILATTMIYLLCTIFSHSLRANGSVSKNQVDACISEMNTIFHNIDAGQIEAICLRSTVSDGCASVKGKGIFHFESLSHSPKGKKILVIGLIHGDEAESGAVALRWAERLLGLESRNSWRIVPISNPDGLALKQRTNARGVDLNRNFPSADWDKTAIQHWSKKEDPRRYPGPYAASEPETRCVMSHIAQFRPDFIISVHTPYGILDFDGPKLSELPKVKGLPWRSLGTFPGSLGRYMWHDQSVPVLTVELKDGKILEKLDEIGALQDISGTVAIKANETLKRQ
jgi:murein peptide amidase A